jgi:hypothetical protein
MKEVYDHFWPASAFPRAELVALGDAASIPHPVDRALPEIIQVGDVFRDALVLLGNVSGQLPARQLQVRDVRAKAADGSPLSNAQTGQRKNAEEI